MTTRQEILQAIKRTAVAGRALGEAAFSSATGIKQPQWRRHWTRWNQAVVEAGFPPNILTPKYADETLGTCLADLARSLGTMPVKGDIDHKKAADPTFPSYEAFRRWKGSGTLASTLHSFCGDRADLSDVAAMCQTTARDRIVKGYVYLKRYGRSGREWKIGKTEDVRRRHAQLEKACIRASCATFTPYQRKRLPTKGARGEIFRLDPEDVRAFRSRDYQ